MYRRLGYFPTESSEHSAEYLPWLMRDDEAIERYRLLVGDYVAPQPRRTCEEYERTRERCSPPASRCEIEPSNEYAPQIIHSIETGPPRVIYGNVRNTGLIDEPARRTRASRCRAWSTATGVQPTCGRRAAAAARGAQPHLPERVPSSRCGRRSRAGPNTYARR